MSTAQSGHSMGLPKAGVATVVQRLSAFEPLDASARTLLSSLNGRRIYDQGVEITGQSDPNPRPRFLVEGWAARIHWMPDGRRQIFNFLLPGEAIDLSLQEGRDVARITTIALTNCATLDAGAVRKAVLTGDRSWRWLIDNLHQAERVQELCLLGQLIRLGRQTAYERMAHLLLEFRDRMKASGLGTETQYAMPLTQETLSDAVGLSVVHVNRILQQLKREQLASVQGGEVRLHDPESLAIIADYQSPFAPR